MESSPIQSFNFTAGRVIAGKYEVLEKLGQGWEGEVYKIRDLRTDIEHAAKLFFPHRDNNHRSVTAYAQKLHKLRCCSMVVRYHTEEHIQFRKQRVMVLISELVEGQLLSEYQQGKPGKRLHPYEALHVLYALVRGMEEIHSLGEYHGDLHTDNIIIVRSGLNFELKLLDMFYWGRSTKSHLAEDVIFMTQILHELIGGPRHYRHQPPAIKQVCRGLKRSLILKNYNNATQMRQYLESLESLEC
ncbi:MAG: protein kinase [Granulosicoccus sp.]|nr:protein kinase [Granulosicoccus sp.]